MGISDPFAGLLNPSSSADFRFRNGTYDAYFDPGRTAEVFDSGDAEDADEERQAKKMWRWGSFQLSTLLIAFVYGLRGSSFHALQPPSRFTICLRRIRMPLPFRLPRDAAPRMMYLRFSTTASPRSGTNPRPQSTPTSTPVSPRHSGVLRLLPSTPAHCRPRRSRTPHLDLVLHLRLPSYLPPLF